MPLLAKANKKNGVRERWQVAFSDADESSEVHYTTSTLARRVLWKFHPFFFASATLQKQSRRNARPAQHEEQTHNTAIDIEINLLYMGVCAP